MYCIFWDCKKSFDTILHRRLGQKLQGLAEPERKALQQIKEYLTGRKQRAIVWEWAGVTSGLTQGENLMLVDFKQMRIKIKGGQRKAIN